MAASMLEQRAMSSKGLNYGAALRALIMRVLPPLQCTAFQGISILEGSR